MCEMFSEWRALSDNLLLVFSKRWENGYSKGLALQTRKRDWNQFKEVFSLCALDSSWGLWLVCVGDNKGEKKGGSEEGGNSEAGISAWGITWGWHFPCFTALSLVAKNCSKLDQARPLIPALCLQPVTTDFPLVPPGDGNIWEAGMAKVTAICGGKNSRRNSAEMKICFYALPRQSPRVLINVRYGPRWNNPREAGICLQMPHRDPCFPLLNFISFQLRVRQSWINGKAKPGCFGKLPLGMRAQGKDGSLKSLRKYSCFFHPQGGVGGI